MLKVANIKTLEEQEKMRLAGKLAASCLDMIAEHVKPGVSTLQLDTLCNDYMLGELECISACLGYHGFPKSVCISINDVVCHGIPTAHDILEDGDIVNIDVTVIKDEFHGDTSKMYFVGDVSEENRIFSNASYEAMAVGIRAIKPGLDIGVIGEAIQNYIATTPYNIVPEYAGHGIGKIFHDYPPVLPVYNRFGIIMQPGMTFTVEPIINSGRPGSYELQDNWTVKTLDGSLSAQHEHTILVTEDGYEVLSLRKDEKPIASEA